MFALFEASSAPTPPPTATWSTPTYDRDRKNPSRITRSPSFFKQARLRGTTTIYADPRADKMADHADIFCQLKPGTDVAFYNGVMHEVIRLGLTDREFIANRTSNYEALADTVKNYPPERAAQITGIDAAVIRQVARAWAEAGRARRDLLGHGDLPAHHRHSNT